MMSVHLREVSCLHWKWCACLHISQGIVNNCVSSPPCRDNPLIHLNYSIVLYNNGEVRAAGKQFQLFKSKSQSHTPTNTDPEVYTILSSPLTFESPNSYCSYSS